MLVFMILDYDTLTESLPAESIRSLVRDCVLSMGDFSNSSPSDLDEAVEKTLLKLKSGKLLVEYGESSETFAIVDSNKLNSISRKS